MHRLKEHWQNPDDFVPARFENFTPPRFVYFPFGGGERICIGAHLAMTEATLILTRLIQKFDIDIRDAEKIEPLAAVTLQPSTPVWAQLKRVDSL